MKRIWGVLNSGVLCVTAVLAGVGCAGPDHSEKVIFVRQYTPAQEAMDVDPATPIAVTYTRALDAGGFDNNSIIVMQGDERVQGHVELDAAQTTLRFVPELPLTPAAGYQIVLDGGIHASDGGKNPKGTVKYAFYTRLASVPQRLSPSTSARHINPVLAYDKHGNGMAVWTVLSESGRGKIVYAYYRVDTGVWEAERTLVNEDVRGDVRLVASADSFVAVWFGNDMAIQTALWQGSSRGWIRTAVSLPKAQWPSELQSAAFLPAFTPIGLVIVPDQQGGYGLLWNVSVSLGNAARASAVIASVYQSTCQCWSTPLPISGWMTNGTIVALNNIDVAVDAGHWLFAWARRSVNAEQISHYIANRLFFSQGGWGEVQEIVAERATVALKTIVSGDTLGIAWRDAVTEDAILTSLHAKFGDLPANVGATITWGAVEDIGTADAGGAGRHILRFDRLDGRMGIAWGVRQSVTNPTLNIENSLAVSARSVSNSKASWSTPTMQRLERTRTVGALTVQYELALADALPLDVGYFALSGRPHLGTAVGFNTYKVFDETRNLTVTSGVGDVPPTIFDDTPQMQFVAFDTNEPGIAPIRMSQDAIGDAGIAARMTFTNTQNIAGVWSYAEDGQSDVRVTRLNADKIWQDRSLVTQHHGGAVVDANSSIMSAETAGGALGVLWMQGVVGNPQLFARVRKNGLWSAPTMISRSTSTLMNRPSITAIGELLVVVWQEESGTLTRGFDSTKDGAQWTDIAIVDPRKNAPPHSQYAQFDLAANVLNAKGHLYLPYLVQDDNQQFLRLHEWPSDGPQYNDAPIVPSGAPLHAIPVAANNDIAVLWHDSQSLRVIFFMVNGLGYLGKVELPVTNGYSVENAQIAASGGDFLVVWSSLPANGSARDRRWQSTRLTKNNEGTWLMIAEDPISPATGNEFGTYELSALGEQSVLVWSELDAQKHLFVMNFSVRQAAGWSPATKVPHYTGSALFKVARESDGMAVLWETGALDQRIFNVVKYSVDKGWARYFRTPAKTANILATQMQGRSLTVFATDYDREDEFNATVPRLQVLDGL